jgi:anti-sigma-K factor RskA
VKYPDDDLREALAAEFALGTLQGRARRRFERSLKDDPALRRLVAAWQERLAPLNEGIAPVQPPARVWRTIEQRIRKTSRRGTGIWDSLGFWRTASFAASAAVMLLAVILAMGIPTSKPHDTMVAVLSDDQSNPAITVSWQADPRGAERLRVRVMGHAEMAPDTAWELWMLPGGDQKPVSLGLITTHENQTVLLPRPLAVAINHASGLAMSVEPKGGSPTGVPTGPILYKGLCTMM